MAGVRFELGEKGALGGHSLLSLLLLFLPDRRVELILLLLLLFLVRLEKRCRRVFGNLVL
jgi:hypothetical protein